MHGLEKYELINSKRGNSLKKKTKKLQRNSVHSIIITLVSQDARNNWSENSVTDKTGRNLALIFY